jgi:organic radical activating enzyme
MQALLCIQRSACSRKDYVFSDQRAPGKISLSQVSHNLNDGRNLPDLRWIYFGGGEPFTQYPLLLKAVQRAKKLEFNVGIETNGYFARTKSAGLRFLRPLAEMGVNEIRVSNDLMHYKNPDKSPASNAIAAARQLEIRTKVRSIPYPNSEIQFRDRKNLETYIGKIFVIHNLFLLMHMDSFKFALGSLSEMLANDRCIPSSKILN